MATLIIQCNAYFFLLQPGVGVATGGGSAFLSLGVALPFFPAGLLKYIIIIHVCTSIYSGYPHHENNIESSYM